MVAAPVVTLTGVGELNDWLLWHWLAYPLASEVPPVAPEASKHTW